jgi:hypothetical protein
MQRSHFLQPPHAWLRSFLPATVVSRAGDILNAKNGMRIPSFPSSLLLMIPVAFHGRLSAIDISVVKLMDNVREVDWATDTACEPKDKQLNAQGQSSGRASKLPISSRWKRNHYFRAYSCMPFELLRFAPLYFADLWAVDATEDRVYTQNHYSGPQDLLSACCSETPVRDDWDHFNITRV